MRWTISTVLMLLAGAAALEAATPKVTVGEPAPDFAVTTVEGKKVGLPDLRGKRVLIFMWASW